MAYRSSAQAVSASATSLACNTPAGAASGDRLFAFIGHDGVGSITPSPAGDWVVVFNAGAVSTQAACYYLDLAAAPDASYTFQSAAGATNMEVILVALNPGSDAFDAVTASTPSVASTATVSNGALTGAADPSTLFFMSTNDNNATIVTPPSGMTQAQFADNTSHDTLVSYQENFGTGAVSKSVEWSTATEKVTTAVVQAMVAGGASIALTGTAASGLTEQRVRDGGYTLIATLTDDTFVTSGATFDAQRQAIIDGLDSAQAEAAGWDAVVKTAIPVTSVSRTSDTICTITLPACVYPLVTTTYQITATETVTWTLPAAALTGGVAIVAAPTFTVTRGAMDLVQPVGTTNTSGVPSTSSGSLTGDVAQLTRVTCTIDGVTLDTVRVITSR